MQKKITIIMLVLSISVLTVAFLARNVFYKPEEKKSSAVVVIPQNNLSAEKNSSGKSDLEEDTALTSLVPLLNTETLISIVSMDFDGDGYDDQVNAIKVLGSPYLSLLVGLYNPERLAYERKALIETEITQAQTFSYTGLDLVGDHRTSLVYQGFAENGDSILKAYFISNYKKFSLHKIADFRGDGTIFINQLDRYDAYERSRAKGASFPIWVYTSDKEKDGDQLQIRYNWNQDEYRYVESQRIRVTGSRIAAKELARIQDGTVATFAGFLNGLWYKSSDRKNGGRYLFFDYEANEVIFFQDDIEEVYKWAHSTIRRNGIYLSTINQEIENLQRRIDISLRSIDEIQIRIQDDVRMLISESTVWDGEYKKVGQSALLQLSKNKKKQSLIQEIEMTRLWKTSDGTLIEFKDGSYTITSDGNVDTGIYAEVVIGDECYIQFRSSSEVMWFSPLNKIKIADDEHQGKVVELQPYKAQSDGVYQLDLRPVVLVAASVQED